MAYLLTIEPRWDSDTKVIGPFDTSDQAQRYLVRILINQGMQKEYALANIDALGIDTQNMRYNYVELQPPEFTDIRDAIHIFCDAKVARDFFKQDFDGDWLDWKTTCHCGAECIKVLQTASAFVETIPDSDLGQTVWWAALQQCDVICNG